MKSWLIGLVVASVSFFLTPVYAEAPKYLFCPISDARLPGPNIKVTKSLFGSRKMYVLQNGNWVEQKLLTDNETELVFEDGWGPTEPGGCKDKTIPDFCTTAKRISLVVLARENGQDYTVVDQWATRKCCYEGKVLNPRDPVLRAPCLVVRLAD